MASRMRTPCRAVRHLKLLNGGISGFLGAATEAETGAAGSGATSTVAGFGACSCCHGSATLLQLLRRNRLCSWRGFFFGGSRLRSHFSNRKQRFRAWRFFPLRRTQQLVVLAFQLIVPYSQIWKCLPRMNGAWSIIVRRSGA